jgi:hypothetical protein
MAEQKPGARPLLTKLHAGEDFKLNINGHVKIFNRLPGQEVALLFIYHQALL